MCFFLFYFSTVWAQHCCVVAIPKDSKSNTLLPSENTTVSLYNNKLVDEKNINGMMYL